MNATQNRSRFALMMLLLLVVIHAPGCNQSERDLVDVTGRVTYQGKPVSDATVRFTPSKMAVGSSQRPATAVTDADGVYRLKAFRSEFGLPPGTYLVSILSYEGSMADKSTVKYLIPEKYSEARTSGLSVEVSPEGTDPEDFNFTLE